MAINNDQEYQKRLARLEAIENATDIDLSFQRGCLDAEYFFGKTRLWRNPTDPDYTAYDAGLIYGTLKKQEELRAALSKDSATKPATKIIIHRKGTK